MVDRVFQSIATKEALIGGEGGGNSTKLTVTSNDSTKAMSVVQNGNANALQLDLEANSASDIAALWIQSDNAGAGTPIGIEFNNFAVDEPIIKCTADAITSAGTVSHQIPVDIGGTTYYLVAYTHGS